MTAAVDRDSLGRPTLRRGAPGETNGRAKLTEALVLSIRASRDTISLRNWQAILAMQNIHVGCATLHYARTGKSWRDLNDRPDES